MRRACSCRKMSKASVAHETLVKARADAKKREAEMRIGNQHVVRIVHPHSYHACYYVFVLSDRARTSK